MQYHEYTQLELVNLRKFFSPQLTLFDLWNIRDEAETATHDHNRQVWADWQAKQYQLSLISEEQRQ